MRHRLSAIILVNNSEQKSYVIYAEKMIKKILTWCSLIDICYVGHHTWNLDWYIGLGID